MSVFEVVLVEWAEGRQAGGPRVLGQVTQPEIVERVREIVAAEHRRELARTQHKLGMLLWYASRHQEAARAYQQAAEIYEKLVADSPTVPEYVAGLAKTQANLGGLLQIFGELARISHHTDGLWFFGALTGLCKGGIEPDAHKRVTSTLAGACRGGFRAIGAGSARNNPVTNSACTPR